MFGLLFKKKEKRIPEKITRSELISLLPSSLYYLVLDRYYLLPTNEEVINIIGRDNSTYTQEINDCDDYSFRAKGKISGNGYPFGLCFINNSHFINIYVNDKREVVFFEPQTGKVFDIPITIINAIIII